jgi:hypothetical protein
MALLGAVLIGVSIVMMNRWDTLSGFSRTLAIGLAVVGTLMVLPLVIWLVIVVVLKLLFRRVGQELSAAAEQIGSDTKAMYGQLHEFTPAIAEDFSGVDGVFYDRTREALEAQGFQYLGDTVDRTIAELGKPSPPIRAFVSPDGETVVGAYHFPFDVPPPQINGAKCYVYDVGSEFSDGTFLATSNTAELDLMTPPPQIHKQRVPFSTTLMELLQLHAAEKAKLQAAKNGATCTIVHTMDDVLAGERRQQIIKMKFREGIGFVDPEEVRRIASRTLEDEEVLDQMVDAVDKVRTRQRSAPSDRDAGSD